LTYLKRIGKIAVFWIILFTIFKNKGWDVIDWLPKSASGLASFIISGGYSPFYFFISLIVLTIITHLSKRLTLFYVLVYFIISTLLVSLLPIFSVATQRFGLTIHWNPLNFLPYPFAAILVSHFANLDRTTLKPFNMILAGFLIVLLAISDWTIYVNKGFINVDDYAIPAYTRPSLVLIAMVVLFLAIKLTPKRNPVILFMSNNSLALYCIHPFFIEPINRLSGGHLVISLFLVLILSYLTAIIMKQFLLQKLIK
jgi:hypothetical protein